MQPAQLCHVETDNGRIPRVGAARAGAQQTRPSSASNERVHPTVAILRCAYGSVDGGGMNSRMSEHVFEHSDTLLRLVDGSRHGLSSAFQRVIEVIAAGSAAHE